MSSSSSSLDRIQPSKTSRSDSTRRRLLDAARALLLRQDHFSLSVDEIANEAGLSRAAFYLHYPNKYGIVTDIVQEDSMRDFDPIFRWFENSSEPSMEMIHAFILLMIRAFKKSERRLNLFYQAAAYNKDIWRTFYENRGRHIQLLGESLPAFRDAGRGEAAEARRRAKARLLIHQLVQVALYATFYPERAEADEEVDALAEAFAEFIREYQDLGAAGTESAEGDEPAG